MELGMVAEWLIVCASADTSSNLQLSFVTMTVFGTGVAPTVTITPPVEFITQMVTVTVNGAVATGNSMASAAGAVAAGTGVFSLPPAAVASPAGKLYLRRHSLVGC